MTTNLLNSHYVATAHAERTSTLADAWRRPSFTVPQCLRRAALLWRHAVTGRRRATPHDVLAER